MSGQFLDIRARRDGNLLCVKQHAIRKLTGGMVAAAIMPWLAREKRKLSAITGSAALRADAAESALCAYLFMIALVGLEVNAVWHMTWADPIAALVIVPLILREGWDAMRGKACGCC